jgi:hypothetical protein
MKLIVISPAKFGETHREFRCKSRTGYSCRWSVGKTSKGDFKALSVGKAKIGRRSIPSDFLPFEIMDAVMNDGNRFSTLEDVEAFVRNL